MKKILVVDDVKGWRDQHILILNELLGGQVEFETAASAREGYEIVYNNINEPFDLIITDLQMEEDFAPKYAGEWFVEQVRKLTQYNKTRIVIISATYNIRLIAESLNVGYITKATASKFPQSYLDAVL